MIIIRLHFDGGSAEEGHDIAHIASSIVARLMAGFFLSVMRIPGFCFRVPGRRGILCASFGHHSHL